jgi:DNA helicase HerA-like ATPase
MRFQGQKIGFVAGSLSDGKSLILRLPHGDLSKAPRLGDIVLIKDETTNYQWLARVEKQYHVSIELYEHEVRNAIARGQTALGSELSDHEKEMYLGHDYELRLLGEIRDPLKFASVARMLPPRGATVNHLKADDLKQLVTLDNDGAVIGYYAVGDEVNDSNSNQIPVKFSVKRFVSRRSAIFGVAGFGKSNLMKNILADLTVSEPTVGKLVFDLDGEYAFGDEGTAKVRYGLADIPLVAEYLSVYTNARRNDAAYQQVIAGPPVLNLSNIPARKVVSTLLPDSRQDRVYAELIKGLTGEKWEKILNLVSEAAYDTSINDVASILGINPDDNLPSIQGMIRALVPMTKGHSASSNMMRDVMENLKLGATVVIDLSSMGLDAAYNLTSFMVDELFDANQTAYVAGSKVPEVIVFIEEAQNLLSEKQVNEGTPVARLAKEGRKYNLGLVYVSQQPGVIAKEILTQTNTYFVLHLLSKIDIRALQDINPHYGGVIADFIQMESLQGHAYIYSTVPGMATQSYVFATKSTSFEDIVEVLKNKPISGARNIRQYRADVISKLAELLKDILKNQTRIETTSDGEERYFSPPISGMLAEKATGDLDVIRDSRNPSYTAEYWLRAGCEKLGYTARISWEGGKPWLYLKETERRPDVLRALPVASSNDDDDEIPF